ncbi:MAG TPA: hypothetical protein PLS95_17680 [Thermoanaerobaculales bacterium]|mgnify:CR=1 FL=1|nr:hypothetical protein [Thermoanaerobaculales bacterium]
MSKGTATRAAPSSGAKRQTPLYVTGSRIRPFTAGRDGLGLNESWELPRDLKREATA